MVKSEWPPSRIALLLRLEIGSQKSPTLVKPPLEQLCVGRRRTKLEKLGAGVSVERRQLADHNPCLPPKGCPPSQRTAALKQIAMVLFPQRCDCSRLLTSSDFVKVFTIVSVVQIRALSTTDLRPATTCPCKAHTEAQAALASWRKAYMEAQAALASGRAPRQALLLDRAVAVREICLRW